MGKRVGIISDNTLLYEKIRLLLREEAVVDRLTGGSEANEYDVIFTDTDTDCGKSAKAIRIGADRDIPYPFLHEELLNAFHNAGSADRDDSIKLSKAKRSATLGEISVKLTELEYKLLEKLLSADGFVTREELLASIWGEGYDDGVVNVYVYYLRRKLEKDGKRIIISSRKEGYKIDDKYRRTGIC